MGSVADRIGLGAQSHRGPDDRGMSPRPGFFLQPLESAAVRRHEAVDRLIEERPADVSFDLSPWARRVLR
jgi:hypothetical protein